MSVLETFLHPSPAPRALWAVALSCALAAATGADADIIKKEDMLRGIVTTQENCAATAQTVWVKVFGQGFCVRYFLSNAGGEGTRPVVFLNGDYFWRVNTKTWQWLPPSKSDKVPFDGMDQDVNTADLVKTADAFSKLTKTTAIYLARIGVDGTSGNHVYRKSVLELHLMDAALDAIKQRHGFEGFHLAGQSGGSMLVTGLAGLRNDVRCVVAGSGRLVWDPHATSKDPARTLFDPVEFFPSIARNNSVRFRVVTDAADQISPVKQQTEFVIKLRHAGHDAPQYFVTATDPNHHGVVAYTELVAAGCILGKSESDITAAIGTIAKRNAAFNEQRRKEIALLAKHALAAPQSAADPGAAPTATGSRGAAKGDDL
jgi:hypothetical protein